MCFAEKDTPAHHAKFRKSWNSKYMSINWWRGVVIIPMSASHWLWTCPSSFMSQWCWPGREGSFYRRQVLGRKGREPSGQWLRMSLHLLSPPSLHKSSPGAVSDWCVQHPKTFPGHTTMALWRYPPGAGAAGWHQGHVEGHLSKVRSHTFPPHLCEQVRLPTPLGRQWPVLQGCSVITPWILTLFLLPQVCSPWIWCRGICDEQWVGQQWLCSGCPGGASLPQVPPPPQLSLLQQVSGLLALQSFGRKNFLESWGGFPFGKLIDINWSIAQPIHLSEEYRRFQFLWPL